MFASLLRAGRVRIHLDARRPGVVLPERFRSKNHLALDYGRDLSIPTVDVEIDGFGIRAVLSFDRAKTVTFIPWGSIFAIGDGKSDGGVWQEDIPDDLHFDQPTNRPEGHTGWIH